MVFIRKGLELCTHVHGGLSVSPAMGPGIPRAHSAGCSDDGWASEGVREHAGVAGK